MNISSYSKEIQKLIKDCEQFTVSRNKKSLGLLKKLKEIASSKNDHGLLGFVYFYYANWYYDDFKYNKFQKSLERAIYHLLRSDEYGLLARSFNFFAIDAQNNDAYDVAYSHYINALTFSNYEKDEFIKGVITINLANYYYEIGENKMAKKFFIKGIEFLKHNTDDPFYLHNLMATYVNNGLNSLALNELKNAKASFDKAQKIYKDVEESQFYNVLNSFRFFKIRYALKKKNLKEAKKYINEMMNLLEKEEDPIAYIDDISDFSHSLLEYKQYDYVKKIIELTDKKIMDSNIIHASRLMTEVKIDLYKRIKDDTNLYKALEEQNILIEKQKSEQEKIYRYSMNIIKLVDELQEEELKVKNENLDLQIKVLIDPLTKVNNRHSLNQEIYPAFERAYKKKDYFGIEIIDVDDFKDFNDNHGHSIGDICLETIGRILNEIAKKEKVFVSRYGGDEFVIIYEGMDDDKVLNIAKEIEKEILNNQIKLKSKKDICSFTISQGICNDIPKYKNKAWDFLTMADNSLYKLKDLKRKKNRITLEKVKLF